MFKVVSSCEVQWHVHRLPNPSKDLASWSLVHGPWSMVPRPIGAKEVEVLPPAPPPLPPALVPASYMLLPTLRKGLGAILQFDVTLISLHKQMWVHEQFFCCLLLMTMVASCTQGTNSTSTIFADGHVNFVPFYKKPITKQEERECI